MCLRLAENLRQKRPGAIAVLVSVCLLLILARLLAAAHDTEACPEPISKCELCQLAHGSWLEPSTEEFVYEAFLERPVVLVTLPLPSRFCVTGSSCPRAPPL